MNLMNETLVFMKEGNKDTEAEVRKCTKRKGDSVMEDGEEWGILRSQCITF